MGSGFSHSSLKIQQCSRCQGEKEFYCNSCKDDLCIQCKERHYFDLDTMYHDVLINPERYECSPKQEICVKHIGENYDKYCLSCEIPVCFQCTGHSNHDVKDIKNVCENQRQQQREIMQKIKSEILYNSCILLLDIRANIKTFRKHKSISHSAMKRKANKLKNLFDAVIRDVYLRSKTLLFQNSNQQLRKLLEGIANIEKYELQSEKLLKQPVRFLLFLRQAGVPKSKNIHKMSCSTQSEKIKTVDLIKFISEIQITEIGKRQAQNKCLLNVMPTPVLHKSIKVRGVEGVLHLSRVSSDRVWISNGRMLFLISTEGNVINILRNTVNYQWGESCSFMYNYGVHSLNNDGELIYLHLRKGVQKLSIDNRTHFKLIENLGPMDPSCVYCSLINGDIMVGAYDDYMGRGMVTRYKKSGQLIQTIQYDESDQQLYKFPAFITENNNRDVIVSDVLRYAVVVTDKEGRLRFSYTGPPRSKSHHFFYTTHRSGTILDPRGICTDALSHILVCDDNTHTVQMIDKDGHFLSLLLTEQEGIENPYSLSYDEKNHLLWIGSSRLSRVHVYRYINRRDILTGAALRELVDRDKLDAQSPGGNEEKPEFDFMYI